MWIWGGTRYKNLGLILTLGYVVNLFYSNESPNVTKKKKIHSELFRDICPISLKEHQQEITTLYDFSPSCSFLLLSFPFTYQLLWPTSNLPALDSHLSFQYSWLLWGNAFSLAQRFYNLACITDITFKGAINSMEKL